MKYQKIALIGLLLGHSHFSVSSDRLKMISASLKGIKDGLATAQTTGTLYSSNSAYSHLGQMYDFFHEVGGGDPYSNLAIINLILLGLKIWNRKELSTVPNKDKIEKLKEILEIIGSDDAESYARRTALLRVLMDAQKDAQKEGSAAASTKVDQPKKTFTLLQSINYIAKQLRTTGKIDPTYTWIIANTASMFDLNDDEIRNLQKEEFLDGINGVINTKSPETSNKLEQAQVFYAIENGKVTGPVSEDQMRIWTDWIRSLRSSASSAGASASAPAGGSGRS